MTACDKANELARILKDSDEYRTLDRARRELDADPAAIGMVKDFLQKSMEVQIDAMSNKPEAKAKEAALQKMFEMLSLNTRARDYVTAYFRFQMTMKDVYKILSDAVGEGMDPFAKK